MDVSDWIALGSALFAFLLLVITAMMYGENRRMAQANEDMVAVSKEAAQAATIAAEAARELVGLEDLERRESRKACLTVHFFLTEDSAWFSVRNEGKHTAYSVMFQTQEGRLLLYPVTQIEPGQFEDCEIFRGDDGIVSAFFHDPPAGADRERRGLVPGEKTKIFVTFRDGLGTDWMLMEATLVERGGDIYPAFAVVERSPLCQHTKYDTTILHRA